MLARYVAFGEMIAKALWAARGPRASVCGHFECDS